MPSKIRGWKCDRCVTHQKDPDGWHMINKSWVLGSTVKCKIKCFDSVNEWGSKTRLLHDVKQKWPGGGKHYTSKTPTLIRVKNLFMTVSMMGGAGFSDVVRSLRQQGDMTEMVVLSGIHGTQLGLEQAGGRLTVMGGAHGGTKGMVDENLITQDQEELQKISSDEGKSSFLLEDIDDLNVTVQRLYSNSKVGRLTVTCHGVKQTTERLLKSGKYVVWSWCHSLFSTRKSTPQACWEKSFRKSDGTISNPWDLLWNHTVQQIVASDFKWVPDPR